MRRNDYDVVIIGAGPAGSTMARVASDNGMRVLVVDKRKELGMPVRCGEGLGSREVIAQDLDIPKQCISTEIVGAKVFSPDGKTIDWRDNATTGWVLERKFFDKWLAEKAVEKGATVKSYTRATDLITEDGKISGLNISHGGRDPYPVYAPLIVSAEGMESMMARKAGFKTVHALYDIDTCYQYEMKSYDHENMIELYFGNDLAPRGYVWIFPKADKRANVGIGIGGLVNNGDKNGIPGPDPKILLDRFIENNSQLKDASSLMDFGGVISVGSPLSEFVKDNFIVVGTAAKQVDPIHGGGIAMAMESGLMAAKTALEAHEKKDYSKKTLLPYQEKWLSGPGKKMEKRLLLRKVLEKLSDDDLNYIFREITNNDLNQVMNGDFAGPVAKVVRGRPQLLGAFSALVPGQR